MKDNWEKHKPELMLTEQDLTEIIHRFNPHLIIDSFQLLTGGLSHTNYKVVFNNQTPPLVVRLTENNENLQMEHALHRLLVHSTKIPVPNFVHITEWKNCSAGILEWKHGVLLKNRMFNGDRDENYALGLSAGSHLASFRNVTFDQQGSLNGMKNIESFQLTPDSFVEYVEYFVNGKAAQWLRKDLAAKLISFAISNASLFSEDSNKPALVHADYNGLNILVEQNEVSAILDWEFALSGSIYMDIGNMLRYDTLPHYAAFEKGFINGIMKGGITLSAHWRELAKLTDLISLLSMLDNDFGGTNRVKDINNLISRTVNA